MSAAPRAGRVDCHAHIIDPGRFAYVDGPGYRPFHHETGDFSAFTRILDLHGTTHALLVQPSCYGHDNSAMLDAIHRSHGRFKGIAVVDPSGSDAQWCALKEAGIIGVRLNLLYGDPAAIVRPAALQHFFDRLRSLDWFLEICAHDHSWPLLVPQLKASGLCLLIDHMGMPDLGKLQGESDGWREVCRLAHETSAVIKLSAPFRISRSGFPYGDLTELVRQLIADFGIDRCIWGSDWPFLATPAPVKYEDEAAWLDHCLTSEEEREAVLWHNPARLFGFDGPTMCLVGFG